MRARVTVLAGALFMLLVADTARAQIVVFGRPGFGTFGGPRIQPLGFGGFPGYYSGFGPGGYGYGTPGGYGYGAPLGYGGYGAPWGGYGPYASPWAYGGGFSPYAYAGPSYLPGWAVSSSAVSPRARPTLHPAVAVPPEKIVAALYAAEDRTATM